MKKTSLPPLIAIVGPTASGKTALGIRLAERFGGEIVSADSRQIYRGMDIGTGKTHETRGVRQHCLDLVDPDKPFTLVDWKRAALLAIRDIKKRGKVPILVGGTGLYVRALVDNLAIPRVLPDAELRRALESASDLELLTRLKKLDPDFLSGPDVRNRRRVIRAIEVAMSGGRISVHERGKPLFDVLLLGVEIPRVDLYRAIDARVVAWVRSGWIEEVRRLLGRYDPGIAPLSAIGYREIARYLHGEMTLNDAILRTQFATHAYARRQLTWFRRDKRVIWIQTPDEAERQVTKFLH